MTHENFKIETTQMPDQMWSAKATDGNYTFYSDTRFEDEEDAINSIKDKIDSQRYIVKDREAGNVIDSGLTLYEAKKAVADYEIADKKQEVFVENFYEIVIDEN